MSKSESEIEILNVFDFDGCLFRSPVPLFERWDALSYGKLLEMRPYGLGYFQNGTTLAPPYVDEICNESDFNKHILEAARQSIKALNTITILLTGRDESFRTRIKQIVSSVGLVFDQLDLKQSNEPTIEFKTGYISEMLRLYSSIRKINIWDDRIKQVEGFNKFLASKKLLGFIDEFTTTLVENGDRELPYDLEKSLIQKLISDHEIYLQKQRFPNNHVIDFSKQGIIQEPEWEAEGIKDHVMSHVQFRLEEFVSYTAVQLDEPSRKALLSFFSNYYEVPPTWIIKAHHVTIALRRANRQVLEQLGGIGNHVIFRGVGIGIRGKLIAALLVSGVPSLNEKPHITIGHEKGVKSKESNNIPDSDWVPLEEPLTLSGHVTYIHKLRVLPLAEELHFVLQSNDIGRLIGKQGKTINSLKQKFQVEIEVEEDLVRIRGKKQNRNNCFASIQSICYSARFIRDIN